MILMRKTLLVFVSSYIFIVCIGFSIVESANIDKISDLLEKETRELNNLKEEISSQIRILKKMNKKEYSNLKKIRILDGQLKIRERELKIYDWNLKINKSKIKDLKKKISQSEARISFQQQEMGRRIRSIYKEGKLFTVKVLFSSENFVDLLKRTKYLNSILSFDALVFSNYEKNLRNHHDKKTLLLDTQNKLLLFKNKALSKKKEIVVEKKSKKRFLVKLKNEKKNNIRIKNELIHSSKQLNQIISRLKTKVINGEGIDIIDKKGELFQPVKGNLLNKFGRKKDGKYNTYTVYNGVNIKTNKGTPVRSVFEGKVLYTGILEGYGNIIIIGHGMKYHSLYGHLDEIISRTGKLVRGGQIIGRSGDTGSFLGESLYFEMRHNGKPIEPTAWLSNSKNK